MICAALSAALMAIAIIAAASSVSLSLAERLLDRVSRLLGEPLP